MKRSGRRMDLSSVAGVPVGLGLILIGQFLEGGHAGSLIQATAALIVFGGTLGAVLLSSSPADVRRALRSLREVFTEGTGTNEGVITKIAGYATRARKQGIMTLEDDLVLETDPFLKKGLGLAVDGTNPHVVREMLTLESESLEARDERPAKVFEAAGGYAPTIGILGAVLGLIQVMESLNDPSQLGHGISVAFVATIYGVGSANLIFLPIAAKLRMRAAEAAARRELIIEGILSIQEGLNLRLIEEKLRGLAAIERRAPAKGRGRAA